jgi:hypothetical protein
MSDGKFELERNLKLEFQGSLVSVSGGDIDAGFPVLDARQIADVVVVICNWMAFPRGEPARNLFAYSITGECLWRAEDIGMGEVDAYTGITSEDPLSVFNYACFACRIDLKSGAVMSKQFTK